MEQEPIVIEQKGVPGIGDTSAVLAFVFANLCFLFGANLMGWLGEAGGLAIGVVQIGVFVAYHLFAENLFQRGATFDGIVFGIFAAFFGGVGGLNNIAAGLCAFYGIPYSEVAINVCWILCAIFCWAICPCSRHLPIPVFLVFFLSGFGLMGIALLGLNVLSSPLAMQVVAWIEFAIGLCGLWICIATVNTHGGLPISIGRSFFEKESE